MPSKLDKILLQAHRVRAWLGQPEAGCYNEFLQDYRNEVLDKLTREHDTVKFHLLQGNLQVINTLIELRGEVDNYIKGLATNTMRQIKENKDAHVQ